VAGKPPLTEHPVIQEVAKKLGATPAQVLIAWGAKRGYSVIPKSVQEGRILSNFKQIELSDEDFKQVSAIGHGNHTRFVSYPYPSYCRNIENPTVGLIFRFRITPFGTQTFSTSLLRRQPHSR
jgi:diketogulonate reductase-like aldo/keto reductase